jgi:hypothetical protein
MAGSGGARPGAGRPRKPLAEKILEGKQKKAKVLKNDMVGQDMPNPDAFLSETTKGASENKAKEIYVKTWNWLKDRKCEKLINPQLLEQYALSVARWQQAEKAVHQFGFLAKHPTTQMPIASPYIRISQDFLKQSTSLWLQIYGIVKENCSEFYGGDADDIMTQILNTPPPR